MKSRWMPPFLKNPESLLTFIAVALIMLGSSFPVYAARVITAKDRAEGDALYQKAYAAYMGADYPRALALLDQAEPLKPDQPDNLNLRGIIHLRRGAYGEAETAFSRAVAFDPTLWAAQFNLAEIPFRLKEFPKARTRFERLLSQTSRFKNKNQWELVQYKAFLCCLLAGDEAAAQKKLEKLPPVDAATPAHLYAQAALAFSRKDSAGAAKSITAAQAAFSPALNNLFSESLVLAGWGTGPLPPASALSAADASAKLDLRRNRPAPYYVDPRLEAAAAEPLPAPDGDMLPMLPPPLPASQAPASKASLKPAPIPPPAPKPVSGLDGGGLLLLH
jgi:Flp pilus assembly protein TadD